MLDYAMAKPKSLGLHWQAMFTRSSFATRDMVRQGEYLGRVATLVDEGAIRPLPVTVAGTISAAAIAATHDAPRPPGPGKLVFEGF
jgi:hypothetical protein